MYGDTAVIRDRARQMRRRADEIRAEADELAGRAESVAWTGLAADAMRRLAREHSGRLRACAAAHDEAADALDHHAREVDRLVELIATIEHRAMRLLHSVLGGVTGGVMGGVMGGFAGVVGHVGHVLPNAVDHWASTFDPPPHGHLAWLDIHLPRSA